MVAYTLYWECPYCNASTTQLNHRSVPDAPSDFLFQSIRNDAKKGVKIHIRGSEDDQHGGARGTFPSDWSEELAEECIEVSSNESVSADTGSDGNQPQL